MNPVLSVSSLTKRFGTFTAVDNVTFSVQAGEIFGFLGPNGAGKTTTIRMILGLLQPTSGKVTLLGLDAHRDAARIRPQVGYMSQRFSLYNDLTVLQNLRFYGAAYGLHKSKLQTRIQAALELAGLTGREHIPTRDLSGGWRQRLALGAAILHKPRMLFLDEPTAGVDPISRRAFWDLLYQLVAEGVTVFVTTHYMDEAEHCHRLAFIRRGRITALGSPSQIKAEKMPGQVLEIAPDDAPRALAALRELQQTGEWPLIDVELYGALLHVITPDAARLRPRLLRALQKSGVHVHSADLIEPSLEDVFIASMQ